MPARMHRKRARVWRMGALAIVQTGCGLRPVGGAVARRQAHSACLVRTYRTLGERV